MKGNKEMNSKNWLQQEEAERKKILLFAVILLMGICLSCKLFSEIFTSKDSYHYFIIQIEPDADAASDASLETVIMVLATRLNAIGVVSDVEKYVSDDDKNNKFIVKIYGTVEPDQLERIKKFLLVTNKLELRKVVSQPHPNPITVYQTDREARKNAASEQEVMQMNNEFESSKSFVLVEKKPILTGQDVRHADAVSSTTGSYYIYFTLKPKGGVKFQEWTSANIGNYLAVVLDKKVYSTPYIKSEISDGGQIDGGFTKATAEDLAVVLRSGYLPVSLKLIEENFHGKKQRHTEQVIGCEVETATFLSRSFVLP